MSSLSQTYRMDRSGPPATSWDDYCAAAVAEWAKLLAIRDPIDERIVHGFLVDNPCFLPGAYGTTTKSGHSPMHSVLFTEPVLPGLASKVPDFMWIAKSSDEITPVLIEIESPSKKWFTVSNNQTSDFSQAHGQLAEWKAWFDDPTNVLVFKRDYQFADDATFRERKISPKYVLIYGRRAEMENSKSRQSKKASLARQNEALMTFDRLSPSHDTAYFLTARVTPTGFVAASFPPYIRLSPSAARDWWRIAGKISAVKHQKNMPPARATFLERRIPYWDAWGKAGNHSVINMGDFE